MEGLASARGTDHVAARELADGDDPEQGRPTSTFQRTQRPALR
jgi:hypothetical protein